ncbi:MAG: methyltransferase [Planctomycetota bacterium]|nr:methyltransferase [Planctomycetota bacterium]
MAQTSRELVRRALKFERPARVPRDLWALPWAEKRYAEDLARLRARYPADISGPPNVYRPAARRRGDPYAVGEYVDEWGCVFTNIHEGVIGEVKEPILADMDRWQEIKPPAEVLPEDWPQARAIVNRACAASDKFITSGCCPRPWERLQFLRGTVNAMMDVMDPDARVRGLLRRIHEYYLRECEFWVSTDIDALTFMDDWGGQRQILIPPAVWRDLFKPMYKDYCDLAHSRGKFAFMHSDGYIAEIYPDLIAIGVDALNSQLFCMDLAALARIAKGRITFWGEIDRQHVMTATPEKGRAAVREVARHLYDPRGGIIAHFEIGPGANPEVAFAIYEEWEKIDSAPENTAIRP